MDIFGKSPPLQAEGKKIPEKQKGLAGLASFGFLPKS